MTPAASRLTTNDQGLLTLVPDTTKGRKERRAGKTPGRWYRRGAVVVLTVVAAVGATLSWGSLYLAARTGLGQDAPTWHGINLVGAAFPLLLDALILGASLRYVGGVKAERPVAGWRVAAHAAIAATVAFNAASSETASDIPWHIVAPAVWSLIVELYARDVLGELREIRRQNVDQIPARLWISAPAESVRTKWRMLRTGETSASTARIEADRCAAARDALRRTLPGIEHARTRQEITRRLWAGSISPADVFSAIGWSGNDDTTTRDPEVVLRSALRAVLGPQRPPTPPARPVAVPDTTPVRAPARPATQTAVPDDLAGAVGDSAPRPQRPPRPAGGGPTAAGSSQDTDRAVNDYRAQHPEATQQEIADALGVHTRTVRRSIARQAQQAATTTRSDR